MSPKDLRPFAIWLRFYATLLILVVLAFTVLLRVAYHDLTEADITVLEDIVASYAETDSGALDIYLSQYNNVFTLSKGNISLFDVKAFRQEINPGSLLQIGIANAAVSSLNASNTPATIAVLKLSSDHSVYLPLTAIAEARRHERTVTIPLIGGACLLLLIPLLLISRRAGDFNYLKQSFINYMTSQMRNKKTTTSSGEPK